MSYTIGTKIRCIKRELAMRRRVYPRRVKSGRMTQALADRQIAIMESILQDYEQEQSEREPELFN